MNAIIQGDFKSNFYNACGCNDTGLKTDLVLNEISNLIVNKPNTVIATLFDSGWKFVGKTRRQLAVAVAEAIEKSPEFQAKLATLIALDGGLISYDEVKGYAVADSGYRNATGGQYHYENGGGGGGKGGAAGGGGGMMGMIGDIVGAIGDITSGGLMYGAAVQQSKAAQVTAQANLEQTKIASEANLKAQKEQTRQEMLKALGLKSASGESNIGKIIVVVVLLLIAGGVGWWLVKKASAPAAPAAPGAQPTPAIKADGGSITPPAALSQNQQIAAAAAGMGLGQPPVAAPVTPPVQQTAATAPPIAPVG